MCLALCFFGLLLASALHPLYAHEIDSCTPCAVSRLQIGANYTHVNIHVKDHPSFKGNLGGAQALYEYSSACGFYEGLKVTWKQGKPDNKHANRALTYVDAQERIGYTYSSYCLPWSMTLFSGLGFRYLQHRLNQAEKPSVKFRYNAFYVPVGLLTEYCVRERMLFGVNVTWLPQIYPTVEIVPLKGAHWSLKKTFGSVLVELPLTYAFTQDRCTFITLKPFYERWQDGRSTAKTFSGEKLNLPKNTYDFWGIELNVGYLF